MEHPSRRQNGSGGDNPSSSSSSPPAVVPAATSYGTYYCGDDRHHNHHQPSSEDAPLLPLSSSIPPNLFSSCRASTQPGTDTYAYCSPMIGRRGSLRLPDLDLREARRTAAAAANTQFAATEEGRRSRARSLGSEFDWPLEKAGSSSDRSPALLLGEELLKRRTPSGLSLMDLTEDVVMANDVQTYNHHPGATAEGLLHGEVTKAEETEIAKPLRTSQSCCIADLGKPSPSPPVPSRGKAARKKPDMSKTLVQELKEEFASQTNSPVSSLIYGIVNLLIVLPVILSFGSTIYHDSFFSPYMSVLMKLTVVSGAVHQLTFSTFSSLPFAVGQVQDAGLIFLSAMARDIVSRLKATGADDASILATVTIGLSVYTAVLGCALVLIGKFQLASYCQLLPSSVVGGYLAFIGFFCGQAGLALMSQVDVSGPADWYKFLDRDALVLLAPGVVGGSLIYFTVRIYRHIAVLPSMIVLLMVAFYITLWATGTSVQEATESGWISDSEESPSWYHTWDFLQIDKVVWNVLPSQTLTIIAMISVVGLSSSLDIAAIEIELKRPLDYNHELKTVGLSNILSGVCGGYTGSYIFSQTIFSLRMGIRSRLMGYIIAFCMLGFVVIPINILSYVPNFFFGSLLMMICLDLMFEWLIDVRGKVTSAEYMILLSTFALLVLLGVEFGIIAGIALYVVIQRMGFNVGNDEKLSEDEF